MKIAPLLTVFFVVISCAAGAARDEVAATPQRPSFSTNTATTHPGWLETEAGFAVDEHNFDSPLLFKVGVKDDLEAFVGVSPVVRVSNAVSESGFGDVVVGGRWRFVEGGSGRPSLALQGSIKLPTADETRHLGTGEVDYGVLFIASRSLGQFSLDVNGGLSLLGKPDGGNAEAVLGIVTLGVPLGPRLGGYAEAFISRNLDVEQTVVIGSLGAGLTLSPRVVFDGALNFDISNASFDVQILAGVTATLVQLW